MDPVRTVGTLAELRAALALGGEIHLEPGLYQIPGADPGLVIRKNGTRLIGRGPVWLRFEQPNQGRVLCLATGRRQLTFDGITFDGNCWGGLRRNSHGLAIVGGSEIQIARCVFVHNGHTSINLQADYSAKAEPQPDDVQILGCRFLNCCGSGFIISKPGGASRVTVDGCTMAGFAGVAISAEAEPLPGKPILPAEQWTITRNLITDGRADRFNGTSDAVAVGGLVCSWGIAVSESVSDVQIVGNTIADVLALPGHSDALIIVTSSPSQSNRPARRVGIHENHLQPAAGAKCAILFWSTASAVCSGTIGDNSIRWPAGRGGWDLLRRGPNQLTVTGRNTARNLDTGAAYTSLRLP